MIHYLVTSRFSSTVRRLLRSAPELRKTICFLTYEELFFQLNGPIGHCIFSDIDRLSRYEREIAANFARALRSAAPAARLLNDPAVTLDRLPLLAALQRVGINDFGAVRLEDGARPQRFPVFIRTEDGHFGPESDLIHDDAAFDAALADLGARGLPLRGRIAIGYAAQPHADGRFRRYSAYRIGARIFADELFVSRQWAVKDDVAQWDAAAVAEELEFVSTNPHADVLRNAFDAGRIDFGRADYGIVDGRVQVYEINTNPTFAIGRRQDARHRRRVINWQSTIDAIRALDAPLDARGRVSFAKPRLRPHALRWPTGWRLATGLVRRFGG